MARGGATGEPGVLDLAAASPGNPTISQQHPHALETLDDTLMRLR